MLVGGPDLVRSEIHWLLQDAGRRLAARAGNHSEGAGIVDWGALS